MGELNLDELERQLVASIRDLTKENRLLSAAVESAEQEVDELRAKVRELEQGTARYQHVRAYGMPKLCPAGYYYADGVFYETAEGAIDAARKGKGHG